MDYYKIKENWAFTRFDLSFCCYCSGHWQLTCTPPTSRQPASEDLHYSAKREERKHGWGGGTLTQGSLSELLRLDFYNWRSFTQAALRLCPEDITAKLSFKFRWPSAVNLSTTGMPASISRATRFTIWSLRPEACGGDWPVAIRDFIAISFTANFIFDILERQSVKLATELFRQTESLTLHKWPSVSSEIILRHHERDSMSAQTIHPTASHLQSASWPHNVARDTPSSISFLALQRNDQGCGEASVKVRTSPTWKGWICAPNMPSAAKRKIWRRCTCRSVHPVVIRLRTEFVTVFRQTLLLLAHPCEPQAVKFLWKVIYRVIFMNSCHRGSNKISRRYFRPVWKRKLGQC